MSRGYKELQKKLDELGQMPGHGFCLSLAQMKSLMMDLLLMREAVIGRKPLGALGEVMDRLPDVPDNVALVLDLKTGSVMAAAFAAGADIFTALTVH